MLHPTVMESFPIIDITIKSVELSSWTKIATIKDKPSKIVICQRLI